MYQKMEINRARKHFIFVSFIILLAAYILYTEIGVKAFDDILVADERMNEIYAYIHSRTHSAFGKAMAVSAFLVGMAIGIVRQSFACITYTVIVSFIYIALHILVECNGFYAGK